MGGFFAGRGSGNACVNVLEAVNGFAAEFLGDGVPTEHAADDAGAQHMVLELHGVVVGDDHTDAGALKHFNTLGVGCELSTVDDHRIGFQSNDLFRIEDVVVESADGRNGLQFRVGCGKDLIFAHAGGFPMILRHADNAFEGVSAADEHEVLNVVGDR